MRRRACEGAGGRPGNPEEPPQPASGRTGLGQRLLLVDPPAPHGFSALLRVAIPFSQLSRGPCFLMTAVLGRPLSSHGVFVYAAQGARAPTSGRNMALGSDRVRGTGMGLVQLTG